MINNKVTEILTNFKTTQDGDKAVEETMNKVKLNKQKPKKLRQTMILFLPYNRS